MPRKKMRLDKLLVEKGLVSSRQRAQALIMEGKVKVNDTRVTKPGTQIDATAHLELIGKDIPFVSRGGLKLQHALEHFDISVKDLVAMDVGASTGGFTDCLLQKGAKR
ncbi:MAG: TlyA family rRNA (cytidine-2'-O)-methyltransferase, partial [Deltaproteobacteria bacterium]